MVFQNRCSGRCSSVGVCSMALASWTAVCWAPAQVEQEASGRPAGRPVTPEAPEGVDDQHLAEAGAVGQGGPQQVGFDAGGDQGAGPFEDGGDDQGGGLVAAGGAEDQHRVAVLGRQQPAEHARGAAQDHPAGLGLVDGEQPQLAPAGPDRAGMLGRPGVARPVAGRPTGQVPQHRGGPAREAADQASKGGVHAGGTGQRLAHVGGPGQGGVAPVLRQVPQHMADVGGGYVEPGVAEGQAGGLTGGPHQRSGAGGGAQAEGQELVAGAGERRRVGWPMPTRGQWWPGVMPHPSHPPPSPRHGRGRAGGRRATPPGAARSTRAARRCAAAASAGRSPAGRSCSSRTVRRSGWCRTRTGTCCRRRRAPLVGSCLRRRRRVRLVVHLTGSFHQGFSARMQARGGGTPRAAQRVGRPDGGSGLRRDASRWPLWAPTQGEHKLSLLAQARPGR